jgi:UDP-hydrolysing UDP-N-acetyl-D-glucosamine 2-epimerase
VRPTVHFVTLSRSDYASLRPVMKAALADPALGTTIIAGGSHLLARHGRTIDQIRRDGLPVHAVAEFLAESDASPADLAAAYARATAAFVKIFSEDRPDYVFVLGDRWELLAVVTAASLLRLPVVHHSGGDITQGSADNQTRYALTCLSHLHLVALPEHRERLLRMGEEPWRVTTTGEPALTELADYARAVPDVHRRLGLNPGEPFVLATFHPTSFDPLPPEQQIDRFLEALDAVSDRIVLTAPNPDADSDVFLRKVKSWAAGRERVRFHESLGVEAYYASMNAARCMIGNSSSGLWEAPSFGLPVVNIGPRQQGRVHGENVVNAPLEVPAIAAAIARASDPAFRKRIAGAANPYVRPDTVALILGVLIAPRDPAALLAKRFVDPLSGPR